MKLLRTSKAGGAELDKHGGCIARGRLRARTAVALIACFAAGVVTSRASPSDTPLVRSIYQAPIPQDPMVLWDRVADLVWLNRLADKKTLEVYLERTAVQRILGEPTWSAPTLEQLLSAERAAPVLAPEQISRVLALFDGALAEAADDSNVPKDYRGQVQYRYEGHSVWSQLRNSREAYLGVRLTNHSGHDVVSLSASVHIVRASESIRITCHASIFGALHTNASSLALCPTVQVESTARPGFYTVIDTQTLIELIQSVEHSDATLSIQPDEAYFPEYAVAVTSFGVQPFNSNLRPRTLPILPNLTCEDRGTCAAERTVARERVLFNPLTALLASLLAGAVIGYALLLAVVRLGGGRRALPLARSIGVLGVSACFGTAIWNGRALDAYRGGDYGGLVYFWIMMIAAAVGVGLLIATLLVRAPDE
jgi:hypothetical protein